MGVRKPLGTEMSAPPVAGRGRAGGAGRGSKERLCPILHLRLVRASQFSLQVGLERSLRFGLIHILSCGASVEDTTNIAFDPRKYVPTNKCQTTTAVFT